MLAHPPRLGWPALVKDDRRFMHQRQQPGQELLNRAVGEALGHAPPKVEGHDNIPARVLTRL